MPLLTVGATLERVGATIEVTFKGEAVRALTDRFEDATATIERGVTCLVMSGADPTTVHGAIERLESIGLELLDIRSGESPVRGWCAAPGDSLPSDAVVTLSYEVTFKGRAGETLRAAFDSEAGVVSGAGRTIVRCEPNRLKSVLDRVQNLGLDLLDVRLVAEVDDDDR